MFKLYSYTKLDGKKEIPLDFSELVECYSFGFHLLKTFKEKNILVVIAIEFVVDGYQKGFPIAEDITFVPYVELCNNYLEICERLHI